MLTYYLRFDTKEAATTALEAAGWVDENDNPDVGSGYRWDNVGAVETIAAIFDGSGILLTPAIVDTRHHVNIYALEDGALPAAFAATEILAPASPQRRFGVDP